LKLETRNLKLSLPHALDPTALLARARRHAEHFALPLRDRHWRGRSGEIAGRGVGSSLDFQDHRRYHPGDDPRHINWQAYARTGDYTLKLFREEVRPVVEVLFDVSGSMFGVPSKAERSLELFYFAIASAAREGASLHAVLLRGPRAIPLDPAALADHRWIDRLDPFAKTEPSQAPNPGALPLRPHSLRVFITDLLYPAAPEPLLGTLRQGAGRAIVLAPYDLSESDPGWSGNYEFVETEGGRRHDRRVDPALLRRYLESYRQHFHRWKSAALRTGVPLARIPCAPPFEAGLRLEALPAGALALA